jgi:hypothetical protein
MLDSHSYFVNATDATYEGFYTYSPDAISPSCGKVELEVYSEKDPEKAARKVLGQKTVGTIWHDFEAYRLVSTSVSTGDPAVQSVSIKKIEQNSENWNKQPAEVTGQASTDAGLVAKQKEAKFRVTSVSSTTQPGANASTAPPPEQSQSALEEGKVSITSAPDGAAIFVDSIGCGKTPSILNLSPGKHSVQIVLPGFTDWVSEIEVRSASIVNVTAELRK